MNILVTAMEAFRDFYIDKRAFSALPRPDFRSFEGAWYRIGDLQRIGNSKTPFTPEKRNYVK